MTPWKSLALGNLSRLSMGETILSSSLGQTGTPVYSANTEAGPWGYTTSNRRLLGRGAIVIGARGSIGFPRLPSDDHFICTQTTIAVEPSELVDPRYLYYSLCAVDFSEISAQQAVPMLTVGSLAGLQVFVPDLDEQRRISSVLNAVDNAIQAAQAAARKSESLITEIREEAFRNWSSIHPARSIGEVGEVTTGRTPSTKDDSFWAGAIPFVTPSDLGAQRFVTNTGRLLTEPGCRESKIVPCNAVFVTCIASIGKNAIASQRSAFNQQINAVICDEAICLPKFFYEAANHLKPKLIALAGQTAVPIINKSIFTSVRFSCPSVAEQMRFIANMDTLYEVSEANRLHLDCLLEVKRGLLDDLLTGRVRVPATYSTESIAHGS